MSSVARSSRLIPKCVALRLLRGIRTIKSLAKLAAVNFRLRPNDGCNFLRIIVPALQVAVAKLAFLVLLVASALLGLPRFYFRRCCGLFCHVVLSTSRGLGKKSSTRFVYYAIS